MADSVFFANEDYEATVAGRTVRLKRLTVRDMFRLGRVLARVFELAGDDASGQGVGRAMLAALPDIEDDVYALIRAVSGVERPDELPPDAFIDIVEAVFEKDEGVRNFFDRLTKLQA